MDIKKVLQETGLAGNEVKVYLALLDLGSALAGEITKKSGVNRTTVYDALDKLIEKGLVSYAIKANRKYFEAAPPERIVKYLDEKENAIKQKRDLISSILPELEARRKLSREPQEATIYKGKHGLKSIAEDVLKTKKELLVFGAEGKFVEIFMHYAEQWHMKRGILKIPVKIIYNEKIRAKKSKANFPILQMRFNPNADDTPATTWIYGDKTAIIVWSDQPIATLIRSKDVADSYRQFFNILWNSSKE
ncbi:MAG: helix-turn-helix domain-containing protein [Nanoarchaeota archaeon]|nr:helix-turn-helix domain-containing protein [Nanoarchaeota archaeon]